MKKYEIDVEILERSPFDRRLIYTDEYSKRTKVHARIIYQKYLVSKAKKL